MSETLHAYPLPRESMPTVANAQIIPTGNELLRTPREKTPPDHLRLRPTNHDLPATYYVEAENDQRII